MTDCIFCKIIKGETKGWILEENDKAVAFLDAFPVTEGHTIVATKEHVDDIFKLSEEDFLELMKLARKIAKKMKKELKADFVNILVAESVIKHAFVHVVPRYDHDLMGVIPDMENKRAFPKEEMDNLKKKLGGKRVSRKN